MFDLCSKQLFNVNSMFDFCSVYLLRVNKIFFLCFLAYSVENTTQIYPVHKLINPDKITQNFQEIFQNFPINYTIYKPT
jgi:hypothetical protein